MEKRDLSQIHFYRSWIHNSQKIQNKSDTTQCSHTFQCKSWQTQTKLILFDFYILKNVISLNRVFLKNYIEIIIHKEHIIAIIVY